MRKDKHKGFLRNDSVTGWYRAFGKIPDLPKAFGIAGIDMSQWLTKEHENVTLPFVPSPRGSGGEILSPRPLGERVRVRGGIFGSMTGKFAKPDLVIPACPESFFAVIHN
jgi:hypothetical protein